MSATGRTRLGQKSARSNGNADSDFCPTPRTCALSLVSVLPIRPNDVVVDAGAGDGAFCQAVYDLFGVRCIAVERFPTRYPHLQAMERDGLCTIHRGRFQSYKGRADWVISNPPFSEAEEFVRHAMYLTRNGGSAVLLTRHGFHVTAGRASLRRTFPCWRRVDLQTRPKFYGAGSDAAEYTWTWWRTPVTIGQREVTDVMHWDFDAVPNKKDYTAFVREDVKRLRAADWPMFGLRPASMDDARAWPPTSSSAEVNAIRHRLGLDDERWTWDDP